MKRLWFVTGRRGQGVHCEALSDEQALERLLLGDDLKPVEGAEQLTARLLAEAESDA